MRGVMREVIELVRTRKHDAAALRVSTRAQAALKAWETRGAPGGGDARVPRQAADAPPDDAARRRDREAGGD
jgi:hypothetical protein